MRPETERNLLSRKAQEVFDVFLRSSSLETLVAGNRKRIGDAVLGKPGGDIGYGDDTGLNIRSGPGREYSVVASAQNGASVTVLGEENGWYQIKYSGTGTGYVSKEFVSLG